LAQNEAIDKMKKAIITNVRNTIRDVNEYVKYFHIYSYLWLEDRQLVLERFLKYGIVMTKRLDFVDFDASEMTEQVPTLEQFKKQIDYFLELYDEVSKIETYRTFNEWLLVDMRNFKYTVLNLVCKWSESFKQYLVQQVLGRLQVSSVRKLSVSFTVEHFYCIFSTYYCLTLFSLICTLTDCYCLNQKH
jgi:dynein heavy chain, axonemal